MRFVCSVRSSQSSKLLINTKKNSSIFLIQDKFHTNQCTKCTVHTEACRHQLFALFHLLDLYTYSPIHSSKTQHKKNDKILCIVIFFARKNETSFCCATSYCGWSIIIIGQLYLLTWEWIYHFTLQILFIMSICLSQQL